ncbi:MAG: nucleotidyltransferase domain-containing protein [Candidatus Omnitrophica bacterium]|nr:nucleotidyltransferase domain-containing protein [Candidatus Omnitrophota bacterium]
MLKLCNINIEDRKRIFKEVKRLIQKVKTKFNAQVYLYGSFAKDEIHEGSDIDLIIIGDFKGKMPQRIGEILKLTDLPIEPLVYTREEFKEMKNNSIFLKEVLKKAKRI